MKCNQICKWNSNVGCVKPYGVPCILENVSLTDRKATNADKIRAMSDEELAERLYYGFDLEYCDNNPKCAAMLNTEDGIPEENCKACALKWLKQPSEDGA